MDVNFIHLLILLLHQFLYKKQNDSYLISF
jgi:hypothetical protein